MKFLALIAVVVAQDGEEGEAAAGSAYLCKETADCEANFDAIKAEWEASETEQAPESEPKAGDLRCGNASLSGCDAETGECGTVDARVCMPSAACTGFERPLLMTPETES